MMRIFFIILLLVGSYNSLVAKQNGDLQAVADRYSKYNAVITNQLMVFEFDIVDDTLSVKQLVSKEVLILNDHAKGYTNDYIYFDSFSRIENIKAATLLPKGKGYERLEVKQFNESHDRERGIFYDDSKTIQFAYPSLKQDAIASLSYSVVHTDARFLNKCYFQSFLPVVNGKVVVKIHKDIKVGYKMFHQDAVVIAFKEYSKGKYHYMEWEVNNVLPYKYLNAEHFSINHHSPHIALYVDEVHLNGVTQKYFSEVKDLYHQYYNLVRQMDNRATDEMERVVNEITGNLTNDDDKVKAIYQWVQNNVKYIAYAQGYMGFIPAPPADVFSKRFGDCKGMTGLIIKMMELAGLKGYFTWVGIRAIPYTYEELPLPAVDNHMIATYFSGDSIIVLDGTVKHLQFGAIPYHILQKEILIGIDSTKYQIHKLPITPVSLSTLTDSVTLVLDGQSLKGNGIRVQTGYNQLELAMAMDGVMETNYSKRFTTLFTKGNNKFKVDSFHIVNLFDNERPAQVDYTFVLDDYCKVLNGELYMNMNLDRSFHSMKMDTTRLQTPVVNDFPFINKQVTRFVIPEGYVVDYLPDNDAFNNPKYRFSFKYWQEGDTVVLERDIELGFLLLLEDEFPAWNNMIDQLNKNYRISVVLKKEAEN